MVGIFSVLLLGVGVLAFARMDGERISVANEHSGRVVTIPERAVQVADHVFSLGIAIDPATGDEVEGFMILDDRREQARGGVKGKPGSGGGACYALLASGARWKITEGYLVDPTNNDGLSSSFVRNAVATATSTWDNEVAFDVFGGESEGVVDGVDTISPDGKNEVLFGDISSSGSVAVTIVWGYFGGSVSSRQIVEWDQMYDDADFNFGDAAVDPSLMDFLNVAAHEIGHAGGMGHPSDSCTQETMYRFVSHGETKKRDLYTGDIAGIRALYSSLGE